MLPAFEIAVRDVAERAVSTEEVVRAFLRAFSPSGELEANAQFFQLNAFNAVDAYPVIDLGGDGFLLYQPHALAQACYETPSYWMLGDPSYRDEAAVNRGAFTEKFTADRLRLVFGEERVHENVRLLDGRGGTVGEIDVLVTFADRMIVLQAKSKRLTIEARKGDIETIRKDFGEAVQAAYDQAVSCVRLMSGDKIHLVDSSGKRLAVRRRFEEVYIFCVVADHYPALSFQARSLLSEVGDEHQLLPPFVMDVFLIDVLTEMLSSPLRFLSYVDRRMRYGPRVLANHELTVLAHHLKSNLWLGEFDMFSLDDSWCEDLDAAMTVRREGLPGNAVPDGILTQLEGTTVAKLIAGLETVEDRGMLGAGLLLLSLSGDALTELSNIIDGAAQRCEADGKGHDCSLPCGDSGLTLHLNTDLPRSALERLRRHCEVRKYVERAGSWFGLTIDPRTLLPRVGIAVRGPWQESARLDRLAATFSTGKIPRESQTVVGKKRKIGRNEPCPCGSGRKYKKCCL